VPEAPPRLRSVVDALVDDQWMRYLRRYREQDVVSGGPPLEASILSIWDQGEETLQRHLREARRAPGKTAATHATV